MSNINKKLEDITEEEVVGELYDLAMNSKRPTARLAAIKCLAEMKGMLSGAGSSTTLDSRLEEMMERTKKTRRKPLRKVQ